jgi:hypothetical protein
MAEPTGAIIAALGQTLVELLKAHAGFAEGDIVLNSPSEAEQAGKVSLFLYQVQENPHSRNRDPGPVDETSLRPPPLGLDLFYLVTPLVPQPETALGYLEAVMLAFYDHPVLKPPLLGGSLVEAGNDSLRILPQPLSLEDINRLWAIFPNKPYRLSVAYLVTPLQLPSARIIPVSRVRERVARVSQLGERT